MPYEKTARFYDVLYGNKDYAGETARLLELIAQYGQGDPRTLLDVATGTGAHLVHLREHFTVEGLDLSPEMLALARQRLPQIPLHEANMVDFALGKTFDVVTCLFSAIGYALTEHALNQTLRTFADHLNPGGVMIVEPWILPEHWRQGNIHAQLVDKADLKICRMVHSNRDGDDAVMNMHHMILTRETGVQTFIETHRLRLFTHQMYMDAFAQADLTCHHDPHGLIRRGLYIGVKHA